MQEKKLIQIESLYSQPSLVQILGTKKSCAEVKIYKEEERLRSRRGELSIYHFMIDAELREVQVWENASDLLEC